MSFVLKQMTSLAAAAVDQPNLDQLEPIFMYSVLFKEIVLEGVGVFVLLTQTHTHILLGRWPKIELDIRQAYSCSQITPINGLVVCIFNLTIYYS